MLMRDAQQPGAWYVITRRGEELIKQAHRFEQWEKLGVSRVKADLEHTGASGKSAEHWKCGTWPGNGYR
jgi:hypothetical protein